MNDVLRAYATLGLDAHASPSEIRRAYKALVKRWHPDRFATDPSGQAEAAVRMREINAAYRVLRDSFVGGAGPAAAAPPAQAPPSATPGRRLTREEIDAMVSAIGSQGPVDVFLGSVRWYADVIWAVLLGVSGLSLLVRVVVLLSRRDVAGVLTDPDLFLFLALCAVYALSRQRGRSPALGSDAK